MLREQLARANERINGLEKVRTEQANTITEQASHISSLEKVRAEQAVHISGLETVCNATAENAHLFV